MPPKIFQHSAYIPILASKEAITKQDNYLLRNSYVTKAELQESSKKEGRGKREHMSKVG